MKRVNKSYSIQRIIRWLLLHCLVYFMACSNVDKILPEPPSFSLRYDEIFDSRPELINPTQIHQLTALQEKDFLEFYNADARANTSAPRRIFYYLENMMSNADYSYTYDTNTATQTLGLAQGNCLSLAILTTALANLVNVDVAYELVDSSPVFRLNDEVIFKSLHIRSLLYDPAFQSEKHLKNYRRPGIRIDYFPDGNERFISNLNNNGYIARYYRNLAAAAISEEDFSSAYWLVLESIRFEPLSSESFNTLAVIYRRSGEHAKAEEIYLYGIANLSEKLSLLKNYRVLLSLQKRHTEVAEVNRKIQQIDDPSPFSFIYAAQESYQSGHYLEAIDFYKKALRMAPYLHEARLALAQSHYQAGQLRAAQRQLWAALESTQKKSTRSLYQAKLKSLNSELH